MSTTVCRVLLVYPRFSSASFWNYEASCKLVGARYPAPPLSLITVAALLPQDWDIRLINRNTEELTATDLRRADLVMTGGMMAQMSDTRQIIRLCHAHGKPVLVGGPDVTSSPHLYHEADFQIRGEAEGVIDDFVDAWRAGDRRRVFEAEKFQVDITKTPIPRFDLLRFEHYLQVGVQFSRGCPFLCEFCDIIELYGRLPRTKTNGQMLAELDALHRLGYRGHVDFVDDNFIGNKKAIKRFLPDLVRWQQDKGYPFEFSTEASINIADDDELLILMREANFFAVFVGIETPETAALIATQKKQNTRRSLKASIEKIYKAGMLVSAGFIVGFDGETASVADEIIACIETTSIPSCVVQLLVAYPGTQLSRRLAREGRLHPDADMLFEHVADGGISGLNFQTVRPRRDVLRDYAKILEAVYTPAAYFERVRRLGHLLDRSKSYRRPTAARLEGLVVQLPRALWRLSMARPELRGELWRTVLDCVTHNFLSLRYVMLMIGLYLHYGPFAAAVIAHHEQQIELIDRGEWKDPGSEQTASRQLVSPDQ